MPKQFPNPKLQSFMEHGHRYFGHLLIGISLVISYLSFVIPSAAADGGLLLTFESGGKTDARPARLLALYVPENTSPTPFLPSGKFSATWTGDITLDLREQFTFTAVGRGKFTLTINDALVAEFIGDDFSKLEGRTAKLKKGANKIVARYESPDKGDAQIRLYWSSSEIPREPIPPLVLSHNSNTPTLQHSNTLRLGRQLFVEYRCIKCHAPEAPLPATAMPDLAADTPSLENIGSRLNLEWMAHWITNPHALRADASMPHLLDEPQKVWDIAAYLLTLQTAAKDEPAIPSAVATGGKLFAELGCIVCHTLPDHTDAKTAADRIPLKFVGAKFKPSALHEFLLAPEKHYASTRMPNFKLTTDEAAHLASFLLSRAKDKLEMPAALQRPDPERGRALIQTSGCLNCHGGLKLENKFTAPALKSVSAVADRGCLASEATNRAKAPDFGFTAEERIALTTFVKSDLSVLSLDNPIEFTEHQIKSLRCLACHERDGAQSKWFSYEEEVKTLLPVTIQQVATDETEAATPQSPPSLSWAGEKLKPEWMTAFLAGKISYKPRHYLAMRMPAFPAYAEGIARGLAMEHGYASQTVPDSAPDVALAAIGKKLAGREGGFSCNQCHDVGATKAFSPFEAPAPNFSHVSARLQKEYFHRWMRLPLRLMPGTKMPSFANEEGLTALTDHFEGNAEKQFEAIWHYLLDGEKITAP